MNAIAFGLKRSFQATLRITRRTFAALRVTAARFDMLYAISRGGDEFTQRDLRAALGVTAATISRMLHSLELLDYVRRERDPRDGRRKVVRLTPRGRFVFRRAFAHMIRSAELAFDSALTKGNAHDVSAALVQTDFIDGLLTRIRYAFSDAATLYSPWDPDD